jgi:outer membrane usher protein FimD/PapC
MGNRFSLDDKNALTENYSEYQATIVKFNYSFFLLKKNMGVNLSLTTNELQNYSGSLKSTGISVGFNKVIFDNKVNVNGSWSANFSESNDSHSSNVSVGYSPGNKISLSAQVNYMEANQGEMNFSELTGYIEVRYSFAQKNKQQ